MSEEVLEHVVDRAGWSRGPWDGEPDRWEDRHAGFPVLAVRAGHSGVWCGYVGVPPGHPWYLVGYDNVDADVHGGLTYAGLCSGKICHVPREGEPAEVYWLGFDCNHCDDLAPAPHFSQSWGTPTYRTLAYVQEQTHRLAEAAAAAR